MESAKNPSLILLEAEPSDGAEILEMHIAAFTSPYEPAFFLQFPKEEEREKGAKRMVDWWLDDPTATYIKVVDTESGKIIGAAKWCIYKEPPTEAQMSHTAHFDWLPDEDSNEWGKAVLSFLHHEQMSRVKSGVGCVIEMISTHPEHERRGAGSMLVKWGTDIADAMGVKAFVQGTQIGRYLYEKHGFVTEDWITVPVDEKWKEKPVCQYFNLERPAEIVAGEGRKVWD